ETRKLEAENRQRASAIQHARFLRAEKLSEERGNVRNLIFDQEVNSHTVESAMDTLDSWERSDEYDGEKRPIMIRFKSPGGSVIDGFDFFDFIISMRSRGWKIDTMATGIAASMAGVLLQAGEERLITRHSTLHLHKVSTISFGKLDDLEDGMDFTKELQRKINHVYAERSDLTPRQVDSLMSRKEVYLSAKEALAKGFVDRIV